MKAQSTARILVHGIFRQRTVIVSLGLGIFCTVLIGSLLWPRTYEGSSTIIIRGRNYQDPLFPAPRSSGEATVFMNPREEINSEIEIIRSRPVLVRVVEALRLHMRDDATVHRPWDMARMWLKPRIKPLRDLLAEVGFVRSPTQEDKFEVAVNRLAGQLRVEPAVDSQIVRVIYRDTDPVIAASVANKVCEEYLQQHLAIHLNRAESDFYQEQVKTVESELAAIRDQLEKTKTGEGIILFSEQSKALVDKLKAFEIALTTTQKEIISKRSKVERIRQLLKSDSNLLIPLPEIAHDPIIEELETKLVNLRFQLESLMQRYTADSQQVQTAHEQLKQIEWQIRGQVSLFLDREVADLQKLQAEERALTQTIRRVKDEITTLPAKELALTTLEKQIEDKQAVLTVLRKKYQDSLVAHVTDYRLQNAKIVSQASVPLRPVSPDLLLNVALGAVLALVIGFSAAFVREYWDDSLQVPEDVERVLGLPVFASIPEF